MTFQPYLRAQSKDQSKDQSKNYELAPRRIILLVEDEPFVREATCGILESAGFEVLPAADLPHALQTYEEHQQKDCPRKIDLVMTDMMLPSGTGQQLGQDLRQRSPRPSRVSHLRLSQSRLRNRIPRIAPVFPTQALLQANSLRKNQSNPNPEIRSGQASQLIQTANNHLNHVGTVALGRPSRTELRDC
jgi:CheY-like chemotaxis protein